MESMNRRQALGVFAPTGAGMVVADLAGDARTDARAQTPAAPAFRGQHQPQPLPFDPAKLKGRK
jgi:superoxide dismutase, Fe-Mn family